jgi:hypothetical protein
MTLCIVLFLKLRMLFSEKTLTRRTREWSGLKSENLIARGSNFFNSTYPVVMHETSTYSTAMLVVEHVIH